MYLCVFKRIHFTVVTLLSTLNKEAEIKIQIKALFSINWYMLA